MQYSVGMSLVRRWVADLGVVQSKNNEICSSFARGTRADDDDEFSHLGIPTGDYTCHVLPREVNHVPSAATSIVNGFPTVLNWDVKLCVCNYHLIQFSGGWIILLIVLILRCA